MVRNRAAYVLVVAAMAALGFIGQALSQEGRPTDSRKSDNSDQGKQRAEQFRQQMADRMKADLGVTDDEWKVLQPKIDKVQTLSRQMLAGMMSGMFGRGGRPGDRSGDRSGGQRSDRPQSEVEKKLSDLQKVLDNKEAKPEEIKAALTAYREVRAKAREELQKAQKELQEVLTVRQEAVLVERGTLE